MQMVEQCFNCAEATGRNMVKRKASKCNENREWPGHNAVGKLG
jgi:hypothetical protein